MREIKGKNEVANFAMKMVRCTMYCIEVFLKFCSKNAYIIVAMCGSGFLSSAVTATALIFNSATQVGTINVLGGNTKHNYMLLCASRSKIFALYSIEWLLMLGKMLVTIGSTFLLFLVLQDPQYKQGGIVRHMYQSVHNIYVLTHTWQNELSSPAMPLVVCACLSFFICGAFFYVYDIVMDTLLVCYCYDRIHVKGAHFHR